MIKTIQYDEEDNSTNFLVYNVQTNIINALRRTMIANLKNHAFNEKNTIVNTNTSLLHNEIVRHRLSLVPLNSSTGIKAELNILNEKTELINVYSNDLKIIEGEGEIAQDILLYKLKQGEEINLTTTSDLNSGKAGGTIYKPIITSFFKIIKQLSISNKISKSKLRTIKEYLVEEYELLEENAIYRNKEEFNVIGLLHTVRTKSNFIQKLIAKFNLKEGDLSLDELSYNNIPVYSFTIESIFINPTDILKNTLLLFKEKLDLFWESDMEVEDDEHFVNLFIQKESPTLLNTISCFLRQNDKIKFAHYNKKHPLDDFIILQLSLYDNSDDYIEILKEALININKYIENMLTFDIFN